MCGIVDGLGGMSVAAVHGPGGTTFGGTIRSMTNPLLALLAGCTTHVQYPRCGVTIHATPTIILGKKGL